MNVLALDPGGMTGAVALDWDGTVCPPPSSLVFAEQIPFTEMADWLNTMLDELPVDLLVMERFFINARTAKLTAQPEALYTIGGGLFLADLRGIPVRMQSAADAKSAYPNEALRDWKVVGRHAKDALRHALLATHARVYNGIHTDTEDRP